MERKVALITGITGQDGSYLSEFLLAKGYEVHGTIRRSSVDYRERIAHLEGTPNFHLHYADLGDSMSMLQVVSKVRPTEIYNLAAQSHVQVSFDSPEFTADVDAVGVLRVLEAVRLCGLADSCRIYQASTSELYGKVEDHYKYLRDRIDFDHMDDYICEKVLLLDEAKHKELSTVVAECAARTFNLLIHQNLQPGTEEAFRGFIAALHQMYLMGIAIELKDLGYHMTQLA